MELEQVKILGCKIWQLFDEKDRIHSITITPEYFELTMINNFFEKESFIIPVRCLKKEIGDGLS